MSNISFVLLPGGLHTPAVWAGIKSKLTPHGYYVEALSLPSIGGTPPTYDFTEDVKVTRDAVTKWADHGKDVVVVSHSISGLVAGEALSGLGKSEREAKGLRGGVIRLVYIMAWMVPEGFQLSPRGDVSWMPPSMKHNLEVYLFLFHRFLLFGPFRSNRLTVP